MKLALPLLILLALGLSACNTLVTRRELYSPKKGDGPYTQQLRAKGLRPAEFAPPNYHSRNQWIRPAEFSRKGVEWPWARRAE